MKSQNIEQQNILINSIKEEFSEEINNRLRKEIEEKLQKEFNLLLEEKLLELNSVKRIET
jgi:tRNA A37 N6-isopentenylltransferase MiaA